MGESVTDSIAALEGAREHFANATDFTIGIEEEYLLVDLATRDLDSDPAAAFVAECHAEGAGQIGHEFLRSQIEVGTGVVTACEVTVAGQDWPTAVRVTPDR